MVEERKNLYKAQQALLIKTKEGYIQLYLKEKDKGRYKPELPLIVYAPKTVNTGEMTIIRNYYFIVIGEREN